jgi:murein DD-endopeptidase MepM/ murein hydrolase activator NlpD
MNINPGLLGLLLFFSNVSAQELPLAQPVPGGVALVRLAPSDRPRPRAQLDGERLMVVRDGGFWVAVVGLSLSVVPGEHRLTSRQGPDDVREHVFLVKPKQYQTQHLTIKTKRLVEPAPEDLRRIEKDFETIRRAFSTWTDNDSPELRFRLPAQGRLSARFGLNRFFNNKPRQPHSGIDLAAPVGTPVTAPAPGRILELGNYFFNGNTIIIDHGQGLISMYNHLSRIDAVLGQIVVTGDKIGEIGSTGRVTGPHLHWSISLNNSRVDPMLFLVESSSTSAQPASGPARGR